MIEGRGWCLEETGSIPSKELVENFCAKVIMSGSGFYDPDDDDPFHSAVDRSQARPQETSSSQPPARLKEEPQEELPKPKRPLSSYNIFFHHMRKQILEETPTRKEGKPRRSHGKIGFADLARSIAVKWKEISKEEKAIYDEQAAEDKKRYLREMEEWKRVHETAVQLREPASMQESPTQPSSARLQEGPEQFASLFDESSVVHPGYGGYGMRQQHAYMRDPFDINVPPENVHSELPPTDQKMPPSGSNPMEPYSLHEVFGTGDTHQQHQYHQQSHQGTGERGSQSPRISDLASQLDDESTQLFLNLFRPPPQQKKSPPKK